MSHSFHTEKEWVHAARRMPRKPDGSLRLPTIITRRPRRGDIHPLPKSQLEEILPAAGLEYLYGLKRIELRARRSESIGKPFATYYVRERMVVLYSLPLEWKFDRLHKSWQRHLANWGAKVVSGAHGMDVIWPDAETLGHWFWCQVFIHEVGHHFAYQYKARNRRPPRMVKANEALAELHVERYPHRLRTSKQHRAKRSPARRV